MLPLGIWVVSDYLCSELVAFLPSLGPATSHTASLLISTLGPQCLSCTAVIWRWSLLHFSPPPNSPVFQLFSLLTHISPSVPAFQLPGATQPWRLCVTWGGHGTCLEIRALFQPVFLGRFQSDRTLKEAIENQARVQGGRDKTQLLIWSLGNKDRNMPFLFQQLKGRWQVTWEQGT